MTYYEVYEQLRKLKCHCEAMAQEDNTFYNWDKDINALDKAINLVVHHIISSNNEDTIESKKFVIKHKHITKVPYLYWNMSKNYLTLINNPSLGEFNGISVYTEKKIKEMQEATGINLNEFDVIKW